MITTVLHSPPRLSTVRHSAQTLSPHHTTTVVTVGCGECVWNVEALFQSAPPHSQSTTVASKGHHTAFRASKEGTVTCKI